MVELAIVIPLLVMVVFGITELGRAMYQLNTISKAAASGARYLARANGAVDVGYNDAGDVESCGQGTSWSAATAVASNLIVYGNEAGDGEPRLPGMTIDFGSSPQLRTVTGEEIATAGCVISVSVHANFTTIFGADRLIPFTTIGQITLTQTVQERFIGE
jgi:hypothetical protein